MNKTFKVPERWALNLDSDNFEGLFGFPKGTSKKFGEAVAIAYLKSDNEPQIFETLLNEIKPQNLAEATYLGFCAGIYIQLQQQQAQAAAMLRNMLGDDA